MSATARKLAPHGKDCHRLPASQFSLDSLALDFWTFLGNLLHFSEGNPAVPKIMQAPPRCDALAVTNDSELRLDCHFREPEIDSFKQAFCIQTPLSSSRVRLLVECCNCYDPFHRNTCHLRDTRRWTLASFTKAIPEGCRLLRRG